MMQTAPQTAQKSPLSVWQKTAESVARHYSTEKAADLLLVKEQTIRAGYCRDGFYLGLIPIKLPNRRLLWPADEVDALIAGQSVKTPDAADLDKHFARKAADESKIPAHIKAKRATAAKTKAVQAMTAGEAPK